MIPQTQRSPRLEDVDVSGEKDFFEPDDPFDRSFHDSERDSREDWDLEDLPDWMRCEQ
jgi:hypothetical protein